ncbi:hypothetical protein Salat_0854100, partial [Sesamum alatum]
VQNSGRGSNLHVPLSQLATKMKTPPLAGRKRKATVISSSQPSCTKTSFNTRTSFILPAFAPKRSYHSFNKSCRFILTATTTLISWRSICTIKLLERDRSLHTKENKEQE